MKALIHNKWFYPVILVLLFAVLILFVTPEDGVYGSTTDWFSQHVALAETIRNACLEQNTFLPFFLPLGGGSNGFQFAYYGYLRPDIIIGVLLPHIPMIWILIIYMLTGYLAAVLLCYQWMKEELESESFAFLGSVLFLTANCFFQTHRQVMFVNFMPFLMLALLLIKRKKHIWVGALFTIMLLHSFFYIMPILVVLGWYWYQQEGRHFIKPYLVQVMAGVGMTAVLLIPTALVILEHRRASADAMNLENGIWEPHMEFFLYSSYGIGLTVICMYIMLLGVGDKKYRRTSLLLILVTVLGWSAYLLNGTLYARGKILVPFLPLILLHCVRILQDYFHQAKRWRRWPFLIIAVIVLVAVVLFVYRVNCGMLLDVLFVLVWCLSLRKWKNWKLGYALLLIMPCVLYVQAGRTEDFVSKAKVKEMNVWQHQTAVSKSDTNLYRSETLYEPLNTCNRVNEYINQRSTMYSSVTNQAYSTVYYDILQTPIRINNRVAILTENNPFLLTFMGVRYMEAEKNHLPYGYEEIAVQGDRVLGENTKVLPMAYVTWNTISESDFWQLGEMERLEVMMETTVVREAPQSDTEKPVHGAIIEDEVKVRDIVMPEEIRVIPQENHSYMLRVDSSQTLRLELEEPRKDEILMLQFDVVNRGQKAVVIDINGIRNKLSGSSAPYPNENRIFQYQLVGTGENGFETFDITLSKGQYELRNIRWYSCPTSLLEAKEYQPVIPQDTHENEILNCRVSMPESGYFVTSIPLQRGMKLWVDGKEASLEQVNVAFAGAKLQAGNHQIRMTFVPPGYYAGLVVSIFSVLGYGMLVLYPNWKKNHNKKI